MCEAHDFSKPYMNFSYLRRVYGAIFDMMVHNPQSQGLARGACASEKKNIFLLFLAIGFRKKNPIFQTKPI